MDHILDLDQFGEVMDNLLRDNEIQMLITMPKGTQEETIVDNLGLGPDDGGGAVEND